MLELREKSTDSRDQNTDLENNYVGFTKVNDDLILHLSASVPKHYLNHGGKYATIYQDINQESNRVRKKYGFGGWGGSTDNAGKFRILLGQAAKIAGALSPSAHRTLRGFLIETAETCIRWVHQMDEERKAKDDIPF